jgi:KaiC/GvpD/RAD55 family RecA-like ATPase
LPRRDPLRRTATSHSDRIYTGWTRFDNYVRLYPKNLVNLFSAPGVGKSSFALNLLRRVHDRDGRRVPTLYITLDTPLETQARRWWALVNRIPLRELTRSDGVMRMYASMAESRFRDEGGVWPEWSDAHMHADEIPDLVAAVTEYIGEAPRLVVVDAVGNIAKERTYEGYSTAFNIMKSDVAARFGCTVLTIHHAKKNVDQLAPALITDIEFTGDRQPDTVLSMYRRRRAENRIALILKARDGTSDPGGRVFVKFNVNWERGGSWRESKLTRSA